MMKSIPPMGCPAQREQQGKALKSSPAERHAVFMPGAAPCIAVCASGCPLEAINIQDHDLVCSCVIGETDCFGLDLLIDSETDIWLYEK